MNALEDRMCQTGYGLTHGDLHGGNLLMDATGTLWMIDFATAEMGHSLQDLAKLLCSSLLFYLPVGDETFELALQGLFMRLAATPAALKVLRH